MSRRYEARPVERTLPDHAERMPDKPAYIMARSGEVVTLKKSDWKFGHGATHDLPSGLVLANSYHCSRYNTNTGRLTVEMFEAVFADIRKLLAL